MRKVLVVAAVVMIVAVTNMKADDYYVVDMNAYGQRLPNGCNALLWNADTVFYNRGAADASVSLEYLSNGPMDPSAPRSFVVPAGRMTSIRNAVDTLWQPGPAPMWIYKLSVPSSVTVDSEMLPALSNLYCAGPQTTLQAFGKVTLPVFHSLIPAGQTQLITGLTLGDVAGHINVSVLNGGAEAASAAIEIRRGCDNAVVDSRTVTVPANTVQQFQGFAMPSTASCPSDVFATGLNGLAYVNVTVSQPSLTYASILGAADVPVSNIKDVPVSTIQVAPGHP